MNDERKTVVVVAVGVAAMMALLFAGHLDWGIPKTVRTLLWLVIPVGGAALLAGRDVLAELGLLHFNGRGVAVALVGSLAMAAGLALGGEPTFDAGALWRGALRPGFSEELAFRGFFFGLLFYRAKWAFLPALLLSGAVFGGSHLPGAILGGHLDQAWGAVLVTGAGGCWFAWLYARWGRSLWVPTAAHAAMNFWWVLFTAGPTAAGGGAGATWGRVAAIALVTIATIRMTPDEISR